MKKAILITILLIFCISSVSAATVSHSASEVNPGSFATGDYYYNGKLGIGTTSPGNNFHINIGSAGSTGGIRISEGSYLVAELTDSTGPDQNGILKLYTSYGDEKVRLSALGNSFILNNLGIGTTTPSHKLDVNGNMEVTGTIIASTPTLDSHVATKAYVDAAGSGGLTWEGYTSAYDGNLGTLKGANQKCDTAFDGSHWCTYDELVRLGDDYPYSYDAWVNPTGCQGGFDKSYDVDGRCYYTCDGTGTSWYYKTYGDNGDGYCLMNMPSNVNCAGWGSSFGASMGGGFYGYTLQTDGSFITETCDTLIRLPCCS